MLYNFCYSHRPYDKKYCHYSSADAIILKCKYSLAANGGRPLPMGWVY